VLRTGTKGYRYQSTASWITGAMPVQANVADGEVVKVSWVADGSGVSGVVWRKGAMLYVWLRASRAALRDAALTELELVDDLGAAIVTLPRIEVVYDLDNEDWESVSVDAKSVRCVSAEAGVLTENEMELTHADVNAGRIDDAEAGNLLRELAPLLANPPNLCR
jgi:hypothetical protein